ncbi:MAG: thymidine phosphorylase [Clostridia bacterium]|nr:thymidine phosphorylase [Clostridia bacterium]
MRMYDIIKKKRDGQALCEEEIRFFVEGYTAGEIPDYQAAALCMAIYFCGMSVAETTALTLAMRDSGAVLSLPDMQGVRVDKHSTGGVGDKTSLVVAPIAATLGVKVAKMSGRGLGHTGGTVDKLEAIPGFCTDMTSAEMMRIVDEVGIAIVGQSADLAPADKLLYALRDVTATVDSIPLIASSIMSKKLAADDDCIVLDVKTGSGSFMKRREDSLALAEVMVGIGTRAGKKIRALVTDMDRPLGNAIGNSLEVVEAIETLRGRGPEDLYELCVALATHMLALAGKGNMADCEARVREVIASGAALDTFARMVRAQGGDEAYIYRPEQFAVGKHQKVVFAPQEGYISAVDAEQYGLAALVLGAGRNRKEDCIDHCAGILLQAKTGDFVRAGEPIATLYTDTKPENLDAAERMLLDATAFSAEQPAARPLIFDVVES